MGNQSVRGGSDSRSGGKFISLEPAGCIRHRHNFYLTMKRLSEERDEIKGGVGPSWCAHLKPIYCEANQNIIRNLMKIIQGSITWCRTGHAHGMSLQGRLLAKLTPDLI